MPSQQSKKETATKAQELDAAERAAGLVGTEEFVNLLNDRWRFAWPVYRENGGDTMLSNKVILVTGAAQGIGRGIALRLAKEGADIALVDLKEEGLAKVKKEVEALGRKAATFTADISQRDQVFAVVDKAEKALGGFDVMVNKLNEPVVLKKI